ncbi:short-chain dehydrogenase/reductase [Aspergillus bombycis]|uniref:Short-chain dehydrogenase/reductase n=1 Tax=Aspergillus bombycis TaxID=109264 RepID=A0A1F8AHB7_9EURO|nr:short-chain dehydrogenase/reductase [Aspergillus bombycis]OGM51077.1 short-chain dehydrogenase/reductase [Aspergillus bombycis]
MDSLQRARQANTTVGRRRSKLVAVFVGGTSGIGAATAKQLAKTIESPTIYLVGRNESAGSRAIKELNMLNPRGIFEFIKSDVSLLREVDAACQEIQKKERKVDLLFMTPGHLATRKNDTVEGLDNNHVLRYYARMRFIYNLLPQLEAANIPARVVSVLAAGKEGEIDESNFDLQVSFSFGTAATYGATMNSLAMEYLAAKHPSVTFIHVFPGIVQTPLMKSSFGYIVGSVIGLVAKLMSISEKESGERNVFIATSTAYSPATDAGKSSADGVGVAVASTGKLGGGSYLLNYDGQDVTNQTLMRKYREREYPTKLWDHTLDIFQRVLGFNT